MENHKRTKKKKNLNLILDGKPVGSKPLLLNDDLPRKSKIK